MRGGRAADRVDDRALHGRRRRRRRDVDRLLEERAVERIGLVEDRERRAARRGAAAPSTANSRPGMNPSTSAVVVRVVPLGANVRRPQQRAQPLERRHERRRIVGAHDAAAARQRDRLDDAGKRQLSRRARRSDRLVVRRRRRRTTAPAGPASRSRSRVRCLLRAIGRGRRRMPRQARAPAATRAAITVGRSPTARTPSIGRASRRLEDRRDRARLRRENRIGIAPSCHGSSSTWQRSVAKTSSTPSRSAASPNARV